MTTICLHTTVASVASVLHHKNGAALSGKQGSSLAGRRSSALNEALQVADARSIAVAAG